MSPPWQKNYKKSNFSESLRDSARRLPGWFQGPLGVFEACWNDFPRCQTEIEKSKFLVRKHVRSSFFTLNSCCVMFISLSSGVFFVVEETSHCKVNTGWKGSTSHPRGKQWLTVYRAPQVCDFVWPRTNFPAYLRSRPVQKWIRCVCLCVLEKVVHKGRFFCNPEKPKISQKSKFFKMQHKASKHLLEAFGELLGASIVVWSTIECLEKHVEPFWV